MSGAALLALSEPGGVRMADRDRVSPRAARARGAFATTHFIHYIAPTRRRRAPKSATQGGMEVRTARDA
jgi:hypothetical protein